MQQENNTKLIISRLRKAFSLENNQELAELLGVNESTIRSWISRDSADLKLIVAICSDKDMNFILTGKSAPNFAPKTAPNSAPNSGQESENGETTETFPSDGNPTCLNCKIIETKYFEARDYLNAKEKEVKELNQEVGALKHENGQLRAELAECKGSLAPENKQELSAS